MDIDGIQTFVAIAELGGFTRAGRRLHRTQPAISRRLNILEHELGAPLFERIRGNARLTEAGLYVPAARRGRARSTQGWAGGGARFAGWDAWCGLARTGRYACRHAHRRCAAPVCAACKERAPRTAHRVKHRGDRPRAPRRGDAGPALLHLRPSGTPTLSAGSEAMLVVAEPGHRLADRRVRDARLLAGERWIGFPPSRGERDLSGHVLARQLIRAGLHDADVTLIDSLTAQKRLAQAGFGLALVPESSVRDELRRGVLVALDVPAMRTVIPIVAVHRRNGYLSPAAQALLGLLTSGSVR